MVGQALSREERALMGVPQSTVSGSLLFMFILFTDESGRILPKDIRYLTYADDVRKIQVSSTAAALQFCRFTAI